MAVQQFIFIFSGDIMNGEENRFKDEELCNPSDLDEDAGVCDEEDYPDQHPSHDPFDDFDYDPDFFESSDVISVYGIDEVQPLVYDDY